MLKGFELDEVLSKSAVTYGWMEVKDLEGRPRTTAAAIEAARGVKPNFIIWGG
jgi:hypothetical protein